MAVVSLFYDQKGVPMDFKYDIQVLWFAGISLIALIIGGSHGYFS